MSVQTVEMPKAAGNALETALRAAARRIRLLLLLRWGSRCLLAAALLCVLLVGLGKLRVIAIPTPAQIGVVIVFGLIAGVGMALLPRLTRLDVARLTERRADLKERLSSAIEFRAQGVGASEGFYGEQWADAQTFAQGVNVRQLYPARIPRELPLALVACLGLFLTFYLPTLPAFQSAHQKQEIAEVKRQGIAIVKLAEDTKKAADQQKLDETKKAAEAARKLGEEMQKAHLDKKQALVQMQKLTKKMEEQQKKIAESLPKKSLQQAGKDFKKSLDETQKQIKQEQDKKALEQAQRDANQKNNPNDPRNPNKDPKQNADNKMPTSKQSPAMQKMQQQLQQMAQAMQNMDNKQMQQALQQMAQQMQAGNLSKQEMQQLSQQMQQLAQSLQQTQMQQMAQQMQQLAQQMQQAMNSMTPQQMAELQKMMQQMAQQMGQMPGMQGMQMAEMDAKTLAELMQALKEGRLSLAMGGKGGGMPGFGGKGPGPGVGGSGDPKDAMGDPGKTKARLTALSPQELSKGIGKSGSAKEFAKYLAMAAKSKPPTHLPNGKINGTRSENGQELSISMTGNPDPTKSSSPYYSNVYQSSRRQAENALNKENIPAAYKEQVRKYFDSIRP